MRVLVVEDEQFMARVLAIGLRREAMAVDVVHDGARALEQLTVHDYDAVVLDRDLPGVHGDEVCRRIVALRLNCRVLMLTAASRLGDKVEGLGLGADDYLAKPFDFPELVARLRALYRRSPMAHSPVLTFADVRLDTHRRQVSRAGTGVRLAPKELAVLELLMRADGGVLSAEYLLDKAWDVHTDPFTNAVRLVVHTLRRKLGEPRLVHTAIGAGYYLGTG
ncbi:response regulator [Streptomyces sp. SID4919]|uniref:response regulator transcription factor n=1 Tax=unclassified Streptomyces TaxID=2593676 RepID=UPI000823BE86|nr:response regulator transcription factor [Streptomyces sp. AmelKG-E11A]MYY13704.1 response regulator [Streptomyces sp. SID4919]SCK34354.1 DNA-binding response regulator, OmpR family, contains REC and winged-helix (wHTH) domain [Streptomyces sp. AmelKG-E11A]